MSGTMQEQSIEYGVCTRADVDELVRLLGEVFSRRDPPAVAVGLTPAEFEAFVRLFAGKAADEGLTVVARLAHSGQLVGALLADDGASEMPEGTQRLSPKLDPILDILGQLDEEYRTGKQVKPGEWLHLFLLGVADSAAGRGIGQHLVTACLENGARKGYRLAVTEATNTTSQHIFGKLGFTGRVRRSYAEHRFEGRAAFTSIAEQDGPMLMDKPLVRRRNPQASAR